LVRVAGLAVVGVECVALVDATDAARHHYAREHGIQAERITLPSVLDHEAAEAHFHRPLALLSCSACRYEWSVGRRKDDDRLVSFDDVWGKRGSALVCHACKANAAVMATQAGITASDNVLRLLRARRQAKRGRPAEKGLRPLDRVRNAVVDQLKGALAVDEAAVAATMNIQPRRLRAIYREAGMTHKDVVEQARRTVGI
jgi:hypothetical protein